MKVWVEAARPRTLPAAVAPVIVGTAAAKEFVAWRFLAVLAVGVAVQVGVNYANDYYDGTRGVDTSERIGPRRAVATGLVAPPRMMIAVAAAFGVAAIAGVALAAAAGWELIAVGALCFVAAIGYSGGPRPYASLGLGELFVFVFFGLVATIGSAYVQDEVVRTAAVIAAFPMGLFATAILVANNLRDISSDERSGKRTLAVRLGVTRSRTFYRIVVLGAYPFLALLAGTVDSAWVFIPFITLPLVRGLDRQIMSDEPPERGRAVAGTARLELAFGVLLAVGLWIS
ncbi:MAG: 1,4-dihydroxy-2-naphthoate polyprenyltransferase [Actinomycetota bacterium]